jgi:GDSL-like Lipase/Acylhydrolase family
MLGLSSVLAAGDVWPLGVTVDLDSPRPEVGHAFVSRLSRSDLSADKVPIDSFLREIHTDRGLRAFGALNQRWGWSMLYLSVRGRLLAKYPDFPIERRQSIGPGNQQHADIRSLGAGRYTIWKGDLIFSASDNSSPLTNGRRYELFVPFLEVGTMSALADWLRYIALTLLGVTMVRAIGERRIWQKVLASTAPGVAVTIAMLALAFGAFEMYQRAVNGAFPDADWPMRFDAVAGLVFAPHAEIRWSNHLDFWTRECTNSLGFLDREPAQPKPPGRFRILLVGDSFVEASQVTNDLKLQTLLGAKVDARLGEGRADVVAIGLSGTGQANQLGLYEAFGKPLSPDLVVLVAVSNDFADNSTLLSAVRNGWYPSSPPWFFFEPDAGGFHPIAPAEDWARFKLPGVDSAAFYAALMQIPEYHSRLADWGGPAVTDVDAMFWRRALPPAFEEAVALTRRALDAWKAASQRDGFRLLVVATSNLTRGEVDALSDGRLYLERFRKTVQELGLPFLDLYPIFAKQPDPSRGVWRHDSHWNAIGHKWAADALYQYLDEAGFLPNGAYAASGR